MSGYLWMIHLINLSRTRRSKITAAITNITPKFRTKFWVPSFFNDEAPSFCADKLSPSSRRPPIDSLSSIKSSPDSSIPNDSEKKSRTYFVGRNSISAKFLSFWRNWLPFKGMLNYHYSMKTANYRMFTVFQRYLRLYDISN